MNIRHDMVQCYVVRPAAGGWEFLQLRRAPADYLGGIWHTVAGGIEPGESAVVATLREMQEEAALAPRELYCLDRIGSFYVPSLDTLWHAVLFCARVDPAAPVRLSAEHDAFRWLAAEQAQEEFPWPSDREAVTQIRREILADGPAKRYMRVKL